MTSFDELLERARGEIEEVPADKLHARMDAYLSAPHRHLKQPPDIVLDVREAHELVEGIIPGALHIPRGELELRLDELACDEDTSVIVYCASGTRSLLAASTLHDLGVRRVLSLQGGYRAWEREGYPVEDSAETASDFHTRYARHISIPQIGERGQELLLKARVLLIGAGGLGSPAALYLAAAGVGTLGLIDFDRVERSNLQRQILHRNDRIGALKTESARETLLALNPTIKIELFSHALHAQNAGDVLGRGWQVIVDGADNFETRYLVNDTALALGVPVVHGSISRFMGQVMTITPGEGPCYRCIYPEAPDDGSAPTCQEGGVLGVLPGIIGTLQATEALKLLLGLGEPLRARMLLFDALGMTFRELRTRRDPLCSAHRAAESLVGND